MLLYPAHIQLTRTVLQVICTKINKHTKMHGLEVEKEALGKARFGLLGIQGKGKVWRSAPA